MGKEILTFAVIEIERHRFYCYESPIFLGDVDIDNVLVFNKISYKISFFFNKRL